MACSFASRFALLALCSSMMVTVPAQDGGILGDDDDCEDDDGIDNEDTSIEANLLGLCEVPSISTTGRGAFTGTIDDAASTITWSLSAAIALSMRRLLKVPRRSPSTIMAVNALTQYRRMPLPQRITPTVQARAQGTRCMPSSVSP